MKKSKVSTFDLEQQLTQVMNWVKNQLEKNDVPRLSDVIDYAHRVLGYISLKKGLIAKKLRLVPNYLMNSTQARQRLRTDKNRPIVVNNLGNLHCDIGFYSINKEYEMPVTYRSGFLVCKDILSRFIFVSILRKNRKADSMIRAFLDIFEQYKKQYPGQRVKSIAFDREQSIMSNKVQQFFKDKKILFHAFHNSSSKSKMAERAIRSIRTTMVRLKKSDPRWWNLIQPAVDSINSKPIVANNKFVKMSNGEFYSPKLITEFNVKHFIKQLQRVDSSYYWSQFEIDPKLVNFQYNVGDFVRPKLIITSSEALGVKRSEVTLENEIFVIRKCIAYSSRRKTIEKAYVCLGLTTNRKDTFQENDISLTNSPFLSSV